MGIKLEIIAYGSQWRGLDIKSIGYTPAEAARADMMRWADMAQASEDKLKAEIAALKDEIEDLKGEIKANGEFT